MYTIKVWETEEDRDMGESFIFENYHFKEDAIDRAEKIYARNNYACVEVEDDNGDTILHLSGDEN
jgi:hypothetical protein